MQRGLEGRRIALVDGSEGGGTQPLAEAVRRALEGAGAVVQGLSAAGSDQDWHGGKYAALVLVGPGGSGPSAPRVVQLVREFLVSDKPLAAIGDAVRTVFEAGGVQGRIVSANADLRAALEQAGATSVDEDLHVDDALVTARDDARADELASRLVRAFSERLEEGAVDEMSDLSFPASDPPAGAPRTVGRPRRDDSTTTE